MVCTLRLYRLPAEPPATRLSAGYVTSLPPTLLSDRWLDADRLIKRCREHGEAWYDKP
jgi:hypothetical protein